jgi:hypothetical protein
MRGRLIVAFVVSAALALTVLCYGQSLPSSMLPAITGAISRDFSSIDSIRTIGLSDDSDGRFDIIVIGGARGRERWRVEILSVDHRHLNKIWDSMVSVKEPEFENSGPENMEIRPKEKDYDLLIEGCAVHQCGDGIDGFLVFSGKARTTFKAKVVAVADQGSILTPKYSVTFSKETTDDAKKTLKDAICAANPNVITRKQGLPFECNNP